MGDKEPLSEEDFIQEKDPFPFWAALLAFIILAIFIYGLAHWINKLATEEPQTPPQEAVESTNPSS